MIPLDTRTVERLDQALLEAAYASAPDMRAVASKAGERRHEEGRRLPALDGATGN